jgi:hypothetical protein
MISYRCKRKRLVPIGLALILAPLAGCAGKKTGPAAPVGNVPAPAEGSSAGARAGSSDTSPSDEIARLQASLKAAEEEQARLRDALSDRNSEITGLEEAKASLELELQSALEELMRSQASVRNVQSRAFAVSRIAEVRVEVRAFRSRNDPALTDRLDRADAFLDRADRALEDDNVGGAAYLAERASELLRQVRTVAEIRANEPRELIPIVPPREIEVGAPANLRKAPRADSEKVGSVEAGALLKAVARQGEWYEVETEGGENVWIHRRLVR